MFGSEKVSVKQIALALALLVVITLLLSWLYPKRELAFAVFSPFLLAFIIAYILNPVVNFFTRHKMSRSLAILTIFVLFFALITLLVLNILPLLVFEIHNLTEVLPDYTARIQKFIQDLQRDYHRFNLPESVRLIIDDSIRNVEERLIVFFNNITVAVINFLQRFLTLLILPLLIYYFLRDFNLIKDNLKNLVPPSQRQQLFLLIKEMDITLGEYFRGILLISFMLGGMNFLGLTILGVDFALVLGIIIGITNIIPYFGPLIGSIPAVLVALLESPALALKVIILIFFLQQVENQLITPPLLGKTLGLHPLIILFVLLLGGRFLGLFGLLVAVPFAAMLKILARHVKRWYFSS